MIAITMIIKIIRTIITKKAKAIHGAIPCSELSDVPQSQLTVMFEIGNEPL
jgi:hypothetical protein